jgi:hypothetical protein
MPKREARLRTLIGWASLSSRSFTIRDLENTDEPTMDVGEQRMLIDRGRRSGLLLNTIQAGLHFLGCRHISLPPDRQRPLEDFHTFEEGQSPAHVRGDVGVPLALHRWRVGARQPGHKRQQVLPLLIGGLVRSRRSPPRFEISIMMPRLSSASKSCHSALTKS